MTFLDSYFIMVFIGGQKAMTRYEYFVNKSNQCFKAGHRSKNKEIQAVWYNHALRLLNVANGMSVKEAMEVVK